MSNSIKEKTDIGSIIRTWIHISLVLILCTCSGPRLMLGNQTFERQIDYSFYSGPQYLPIVGVTVCAISRIDVQAFRLWHPELQWTWRPYQQTHVLGYCPLLLYTSDAADERVCVGVGGRRSVKKNKGGDVCICVRVCLDRS